MTVRLWARTPEEAELISPAAVPDLSVETVAGLIPFTTEDPILRCLKCDRLLTAAEYAHPSHLCPMRAFPASEADDGIALDADELLVAYTAAGARLVILGISAAISVAAIYGLVAGTYRLLDWLLR